MAFKNKAATNKVKIPPFCVLLTPFPEIPFKNGETIGFINKEAIDVINEATLSAIKGGRTPTSCFLISCFTV